MYIFQCLYLRSTPNNYNIRFVQHVSRSSWVNCLPDLHQPSNMSLSTGAVLIKFFLFALSPASYLHIRSSFQSLLITSIQVTFGLPLQLGPLHFGYCIHFFVQTSSSFLCTCPKHLNLFLCSTVLMLSIPSLSLSSAGGTLSCKHLTHTHLTFLISVRSSFLSSSFVIGHVSLPWNRKMYCWSTYVCGNQDCNEVDDIVTLKDLQLIIVTVTTFHFLDSRVHPVFKYRLSAQHTVGSTVLWLC